MGTRGKPDADKKAVIEPLVMEDVDPTTPPTADSAEAGDGGPHAKAALSGSGDTRVRSSLSGSGDTRISAGLTGSGDTR